MTYEIEFSDGNILIIGSDSGIEAIRKAERQYPHASVIGCREIGNAA